MAKGTSALTTVGVFALTLFGIACGYHLLYWVLMASNPRGDVHAATSHVYTWLALGVATALVWARLFWLMYFPIKQEKEKKKSEKKEDLTPTP